MESEARGDGVGLGTGLGEAEGDAVDDNEPLALVEPVGATDTVGVASVLKEMAGDEEADTEGEAL